MLLSHFFVTELNKALTVLAISATPLIELRGSIPYGATQGIPFIENLFLSVIGNMLPVPFIILFIRQIFRWMRRKNLFHRQINWAIKHIMRKQYMIKKYQIIGLAILVAIPLPGTGAWTGAMLAGLLNIRLRSAIPAILLGVIIAGILVSGMSYGFITFIKIV